MNTEPETRCEPETTTTTPETASPPSSERDEHGHFRAGNRGGPGNPFARQIARLRQALLNAVSEADLLEVIEMLKRKAKEGDVAAARLLLSYTIGKPAPAPEPDRLDLDEFAILVKNHQVPLDLVQSLADALPVDLLLKVFRPLLPLLFDVKKDKMTGILSGRKTVEEVLAEGKTNADEDLDDDEEEDEDEEDAEGEEDGIEPSPDQIPAWMHKLVEEDARQQAAAAAGKLPPRVEERLDRQPKRRPAPTGAPSTNGSKGQKAPIGNGSIGRRAPSANGDNGKHTA